MFEYAITLTKCPLYNVSRRDIFQFFYNTTIELLVSQEDHADLYSVHFHIFLVSLNEVRLFR